MKLTAQKNTDGEIVAIDIDFNCRNCGDPVKMRYNVELKGTREKMFLDQARQELCSCDFNKNYRCIQNGVEKLIGMMGEI